MLTIRLQRVGKKKFPTYRMVISEKTKDTQGDHLELLGNYNPHAKENQLNVDADRVKYWISKGAQMSDTVNNLLLANNIIEGKKKKSVYLSKKRLAKLEEKNKAKAEAAAASAPAPAPEAPAAEASVPEVPAEAKAEVKTEEKPVEAPAEEPVKAEAVQEKAEAPAAEPAPEKAEDKAEEPAEKPAE